jgi:hypothetical protein
MFGGDSTSLTAASNYAKAHGGGTVGVESQGSAASAIIASDANVAGLGGFSGRESTVSVKWLAMEIKSGHLRWLLDESSTTGATAGVGGGFPGFGGGSTSGGSTSGGSTSGGTPAGGSTTRGVPGFGSRGGGSSDNRDGSEKTIALAEKVGRKVTFTTSSGTKVTMYDLRGKAAALLSAASSGTGSSTASSTTV